MLLTMIEDAIIQPMEYIDKFTKFEVYYYKDGMRVVEVEKPLTLAQMLNRERRAYMVKGIS